MSTVGQLTTPRERTRGVFHEYDPALRLFQSGKSSAPAAGTDFRAPP